MFYDTFLKSHGILIEHFFPFQLKDKNYFNGENASVHMNLKEWQIEFINAIVTITSTDDW